MKPLLKIVVGLIGLVVIFLGVRQMSRGVHEMNGTNSLTTPELGQTYISTQNNCLFRIPKGWESKSGPQPGMTMISSPKSSGFSSNMVMTMKPSDGSLEAYVEANKRALQRDVPMAKIVSEAPFVTDAKVTAQKVELQNAVNEMKLAQTMYFFEDRKAAKVILTWTAPEKFGSQLAPIFDDCMKTFAFTNS